MRQKLLEILKKDAFFKQRVVLSSGKESDCYIDVRKVSFSSQGLYLISRLIWERIKVDAPTAIGGPTLGADPIVAGVCIVAHLENKALKGFIIRKEPKRYGRQRLIEGKELNPDDRVVLVDDVATSGSSLTKSIGILKESNVNVIKVMTIVDRKEGARETFADLACPFESLFTKDDFR